MRGMSSTKLREWGDRAYMDNVYCRSLIHTHIYIYTYIHTYTGLFISPSGTSELDCATTKKDTAERSISIGRESLKFFLY